jgi:predicted 3-demethylubiquinone-9 3-methyltransferase (glyoxalase superfamily)
VQKIVTNLWFDTEAEEAAKFYTSIFKNSKIRNVSYYGDTGPRPAGTVLTVDFELDGQQFTALNGGPDFKFTEAISLLVNCESQEEVDELWEKLLQGGSEQQCGWLKDKYGLSWQIIPTALGEMMADEDPERAKRVMAAMLQMVKIDIEGLKRAYEGTEAQTPTAR